MRGLRIKALLAIAFRVAVRICLVAGEFIATWYPFLFVRSAGDRLGAKDVTRGSTDNELDHGKSHSLYKSLSRKKVV